MLAMLTPPVSELRLAAGRGALRVAARGSGPPIPSAALRDTPGRPKRGPCGKLAKIEVARLACACMAVARYPKCVHPNKEIGFWFSRGGTPIAAKR